MIKYLGSKRQLIPHILEAISAAAPDARSVLDLFSGTSRVGYALKKAGYQVFANDHNTYAFTLAQCYIETDLPQVQKDACLLIEEFNALSGSPGYFTENFCIRSRFFHPSNGEKIDAIRQAIVAKDLPARLQAVVLVSLMEAADRVDSTCGIQMAYLKAWAKRAHKPLQLRLPLLLPKAKEGPSYAYSLDALIAACQLHADVAYLDPPYNQHSYRSNYHIWETLIRWDKPELYGRAAKRLDCQTMKSPFNSKSQFIATFAQLIALLKTKTIIVSFNNEGFVTHQQMQSLLSQHGTVSAEAIDYKRYVGAQIGVYNPQGQRVGKSTHLYNKEYIYKLLKH